jgi:hypothetical protein
MVAQKRYWIDATVTIACSSALSSKTPGRSSFVMTTRPSDFCRSEPTFQQRRGLGSRHASLGRPDEYLSVDIRRHPLDADQLATQFFETVMIETKAQLDAAIGDAALSDGAPEDLRSTRSKFMLPPPLPRPSPLPSDGRYPDAPKVP